VLGHGRSLTRRVRLDEEGFVILWTFDVQTISAQDIVDTVREGLIALHADVNIVSANRAIYAMFAVDPGETLTRQIYGLGDGQ
jgi:hypothetical protein